MFQFFFLFSFTCYVPTRSLHSFPTRRSSDLDRVGRLFAVVAGQSIAVVLRHWMRHRRPKSKPSRAYRKARCRSEEHTSELQSPCNLVCRLLLEKKKSHK